MYVFKVYACVCIQFKYVCISSLYMRIICACVCSQFKYVYNTHVQNIVQTTNAHIFCTCVLYRDTYVCVHSIDVCVFIVYVCECFMCVYSMYVCIHTLCTCIHRDLCVSYSRSLMPLYQVSFDSYFMYMHSQRLMCLVQQVSYASILGLF